MFTSSKCRVMRGEGTVLNNHLYLSAAGPLFFLDPSRAVPFPAPAWSLGVLYLPQLSHLRPASQARKLLTLLPLSLSAFSSCYR